MIKSCLSGKFGTAREEVASLEIFETISYGKDLRHHLDRSSFIVSCTSFKVPRTSIFRDFHVDGDPGLLGRSSETQHHVSRNLLCMLVWTQILSQCKSKRFFLLFVLFLLVFGTPSPPSSWYVFIFRGTILIFLYRLILLLNIGKFINPLSILQRLDGGSSSRIESSYFRWSTLQNDTLNPFGSSAVISLRRELSISQISILLMLIVMIWISLSNVF